MPLEVSVPTRMPAAATQRITRRGATFEPRAELRKFDGVVGDAHDDAHHGQQGQDDDDCGE